MFLNEASPRRMYICLLPVDYSNSIITLVFAYALIYLSMVLFFLPELLMAKNSIWCIKRVNHLNMVCV